MYTSGFPKRVGYHRVHDRPASVRFQALPQHCPHQHSRQVLGNPAVRMLIMIDYDCESLRYEGMIYTIILISGWETPGRAWGRRRTLPYASWWTPQSPPNSSLRSSSRIFLTRMARYTHGELVMVLSSSPEHRHGVNESSLINLFSGAWGAASPTTKHTECPWSSNLECEQVHPQYCGWAQRFPGDHCS